MFGNGKARPDSGFRHEIEQLREDLARERKFSAARQEAAVKQAVEQARREFIATHAVVNLKSNLIESGFHRFKETGVEAFAVSMNLNGKGYVEEISPRGLKANFAAGMGQHYVKASLEEILCKAMIQMILRAIDRSDLNDCAKEITEEILGRSWEDLA